MLIFYYLDPRGIKRGSANKEKRDILAKESYAVVTGECDIKLFDGNLMTADRLNDYTAVFYYKGYPSVDGVVKVKAESRDEALAIVRGMVDNKDGAIPGNWDRYVVS